MQAISRDDQTERRFYCGNKIFDLGRRTHIMGILNVTPDSFSDGGIFLDSARAIAHGMEMAAEGADIIDIGAESTRPGAEPISEAEELRRLLPVVEGLAAKIDVPISIDTYKSGVASAALEAGAAMINDISGLRFDPRLKEVAAAHQVPVIIMHIKGEPRNMQQNPRYDDLIGEILQYLGESIQQALGAGIDRSKIIIDPGIGFGKRLADNYEILRRLSEFKRLGCPLLVGPSRKSFIGNVLNLPPDQRLEGTLVAVTAAILQGADIVRVHDVKQVRRACRIADILAGKTAATAAGVT